MSDNVDPDVKQALNELTEKRFAAEADRMDAIKRYKQQRELADQQQAALLAGIDKTAREIDRQIWQLIKLHRKELLPGVQRSFVTWLGIFRFRKVNARTAIINLEGLMATARQAGVIRQFCDPPRGGWTFNPKKFFDWLKRNDEYRDQYDDFLEEIPEHDSLGLQRNWGNPSDYDSRLSDKSIILHEP